MIYGFSPHLPKVTARLIELGLPCRRRGCGCTKGAKR